MIATLSDWLRLSEFVVPEQGVEATVLKAGVARALISDIIAAGIQEAGLTERADVAGLGTVTVATEGGPVLMRLPAVLAEWASEMCLYARNGAKPFPARLRFERDGDGIAVGPAESSSASGPAAESLVVYVDESGNSGDAAGRPQDPVTGQPTFALVALGEVEGSSALDKELLRLRRNHGLDAIEIKSRPMDRHPQFVAEVVAAICDSGSPLFVEVMDKQFFVATNLVTYALGEGWLDFASERARALANEFAEALTEQLDPTILTAYGEFARAPSSETYGRFEQTFRCELRAARGRAFVRHDLIIAIEEAFSFTVDERRGQVDTEQQLLETLLPPPDRSVRKGKLLAMLPHVNAFTNLYARINRHARSRRGVRVLHDEQLQFGPILRDYANKLGRNDYADVLDASVARAHADWSFVPAKFALEFVKSHEHAGVLLADVIARFCTRRMSAVIAGRQPPDGFDETARRLERLGTSGGAIGVNVVSTTARVAAFFGG